MSPALTPAQKNFSLFAWFVLLFNVPVIIWGAWVRVSYSGDGCGAHWPFCNGQAIPDNMARPTIIEFTHRMMTTADMLLVLALVAFAFWVYPKRHLVRRYAVASLVFLLVEALLGAGLVLFRMVVRSQASGRPWYLSAHLTNTMLLMATMTLTAWIASNGYTHFRIRSATPGLLWSTLITGFVSVSGAIAALGDMLFPTESLAQGVQRDFASGSPLLLRLRLAHPLIALIGAAVVIWLALSAMRSSRSAAAKKTTLWLVALYAFQLLWGAANLSLLAPIWMQLSHLFVADVVWIAMVLAAAESAAAAPVFKDVLRTAVADSGGPQSAMRNPA